MRCFRRCPPGRVSITGAQDWNETDVGRLGFGFSMPEPGGADLADPNGDQSGASYVIFDVAAVSKEFIFSDSFE